MVTADCRDFAASIADSLKAQLIYCIWTKRKGLLRQERYGKSIVVFHCFTFCYTCHVFVTKLFPKICQTTILAICQIYCSLILLPELLLTVRVCIIILWSILITLHAVYIHQQVSIHCVNAGVLCNRSFSTRAEIFDGTMGLHFGIHTFYRTSYVNVWK